MSRSIVSNGKGDCGVWVWYGGRWPDKRGGTLLDIVEPETMGDATSEEQILLEMR